MQEQHRHVIETPIEGELKIVRKAFIYHNVHLSNVHSENQQLASVRSAPTSELQSLAIKGDWYEVLTYASRLIS